MPSTRYPPTADEIARAREEWAGELEGLRQRYGAELTPTGLRALLEWGAESGASGGDVERLPVAVWGVSYRDAVRLVLLDAAARQWTDGELEALLASTGTDDPERLVGLYRDEIVDARLLARGLARDALWSMLAATKVIVVRSGETSDLEHVPDNTARLAAAREILRQYGGHTSKGFAEDVQRELEQLDRNPNPQHVTH